MGDDRDDDLPIIALTPDDGAPPTANPRPRAPRRRAWIGGAVVVVAAGAVGGVAIAHGDRPRRAERTNDTIVLPAATLPPSTAPNVVPDAEFVGAMGVVAPGVGWVINGSTLSRTVDNGSTWQIVTPPGTVDPIGHVDALTFLDRDHAWVAVAEPAQPFTIWRTADGGRSWEPLRGHFCTPTVAVPSCAPSAFSFIDPAHGWAIVQYNGVAGRLLSTHDGGSHWTAVGETPVTTALRFVGPREAWGVSAENAPRSGPAIGAAIFHTVDGGTTWRRVPLPNDERGTPVFLVDSPFFGPGEIVAAGVATATDGHATVTVFRSRDGGSTWSRRAVPPPYPPDGETTAAYRFSAADADDWALSTGTFVHLTRDGGRTWSTTIPTSGAVHEVALASDVDAWILAAPGPCTAEGSCDGWLLYATSDRGATWGIGSPRIGVTANRLP